MNSCQHENLRKFTPVYMRHNLNPIFKDKSRVVIIVDYSRNYTVVNGVKYFFQFFSLLIWETTYFNLLRKQNDIILHDITSG